jgi:hypothetical protein
MNYGISPSFLFPLRVGFPVEGAGPVDDLIATIACFGVVDRRGYDLVESALWPPPGAGSRGRRSAISISLHSEQPIARREESTGTRTTGILAELTGPKKECLYDTIRSLLEDPAPRRRFS